MQCGKQIVTTDTRKLRGNKDFDLYSRRTVAPGLGLDSAVSVHVSMTKGQPTCIHLSPTFSTADFSLKDNTHKMHKYNTAGETMCGQKDLSLRPDQLL